MAKKKELLITNIFKIFLEGAKLYFQNIGKFINYMTFPVMGQIIAIFLIFGTVHLYVNNINKIISINPAFDNIAVIMIMLLLMIIPSFMLFFAAFWKYLVAMGALNSMAINLISKAKLEDLSIHNDTVTRRTPTFLGLLLLLSLLGLTGLIPFLWIVLLVVLIYFCLVFQVFALEENLGAFDIIKKSTQLIRGNFFKASLLLFLLWLSTYQVLPTLIDYAFTKADLYKYIVAPIESFCKNLPLEETQNMINSIFVAVNNNLNFIIDSSILAKSISVSILAFIVVCYTLPLRSICCTLLYKELETKKLKEKKIKEL